MISFKNVAAFSAAQRESRWQNRQRRKLSAKVRTRTRATQPVKAAKKAVAEPQVAETVDADLAPQDFEVPHDQWDKLEDRRRPQRRKGTTFQRYRSPPEFAEEEWLEKAGAEEEKPLLELEVELAEHEAIDDPVRMYLHEIGKYPL